MFEHIRVGHIWGQVRWLAPQVDHVLPTYALVRPPGRSCLWVPVHRVVAGLLVTQELRQNCACLYAVQFTVRPGGDIDKKPKLGIVSK